MAELDVIVPDWSVPERVRALQTTRLGGVSKTPFDSLNLGSHVGDKPQAVARNRALLGSLLPAQPLWLEQVHGIAVVEVDGRADCPRADASIARAPGRVCAVMTADCLPVLFCDDAGSVVAAAHAGWRGLCDGVLEATIAHMGVEPRTIRAWLGPAIGPDAFEVGDEVRRAFLQDCAAAAPHFAPGRAVGKWLADLYGLARLRLNAAGVGRVCGGGWCTHADATRFFSYRRDGVTGRMASMIWLA